mmetsp:Transcript_100123/g.238680  ORF Transcript_100123/g.238680 Transcript_100123/m.238680 type:complete len:285 (-) Transcript_100123:496-1350(-)
MPLSLSLRLACCSLVSSASPLNRHCCFGIKRTCLPQRDGFLQCCQPQLRIASTALSVHECLLRLRGSFGPPSSSQAEAFGLFGEALHISLHPGLGGSTGQDVDARVDFDVHCPGGKLQAAQRLSCMRCTGAHANEHCSLAVSPQGIGQHQRELAVPDGDMLLPESQSIDHIPQGQQAPIDGIRLLETKALNLALLRSLRAGQVHHAQKRACACHTILRGNASTDPQLEDRMAPAGGLVHLRFGINQILACSMHKIGEIKGREAPLPSQRSGASALHWEVLSGIV